MSNPSKRKGTSFEVLTRDYFIAEWDDRINRLALAGTKDMGDLANFRIGPHKIAVECKASDEYKAQLAGWIREAEVERKNLGALASIVVHKRKGKGAAQDQYVTCTLGDFFLMLKASAQGGSVSL